VLGRDVDRRGAKAELPRGVDQDVLVVRRRKLALEQARVERLLV
jgi:hypothetical protein